MGKYGHGQQYPAAQHQGHQGDEPEEEDPRSPGHSGELGEVVGVGDRATAAPTVALQLEDRAYPAEEQEPGRRVAEGRLHGRACLKRHDHDHHDGEADRQDAVGIADRQERRGQDDQHQPEHRGQVMRGQQHGRARPEQRRRHVSGRRHEHDARTGPLAPRVRHPRGVRVQPDPVEPTA